LATIDRQIGETNAMMRAATQAFARGSNKDTSDISTGGGGETQAANDGTPCAVAAMQKKLEEMSK
jgi:hypothetical protein